MEKVITSLVEICGSQVNAAKAVGVTDRTFRNYVRSPDRVPEPICRLMRSLVHGEPSIQAQPEPCNLIINE